MADLVVGLAKSVVDGALTKAHSAIEEEAKLRKSAQRDLVFITGEFEMMQSFLNVANEERVDNKVVKTWVRQIRELAYDVEDCIELVVHLDKKTRIWCYIRRICLPWIPQPLDQAVDEIEQLKARVQDVSTRNARYNLISDTGSKPVVVQQPPPVSGATTASTMLAEAREATMRQQASGDLSRLVTNKDGDLGVISVWGSDGDHGITSIIRKTYSDPEICENFACRAWMKLMHPFNPHEFILGLMSQFYTTSIRDQEEDGIRGIQVITKMEATRGDLFNEFEKVISEARYLVILEDLSDMVEWDAVRAFLPNTKSGSWIIVSTQQAEIASLCIGHSYQILELKRFSAEHSVCALFKEISQVSGDKVKEPMESGLSRGSSYSKMLSRKEGAEEWRENFSLVVHGSQTTELHKYIAKARFSSSHVMSVWGISGIGKSALVKKVYDDITIVRDGGQFEMWRWVAVSQPFILRDFCWSLLSDSHSVKDPIEACRTLLAQPCLIVIDDLQSTEEWDLIQDALVSTSSSSVIIVITTEATIARHCCIDNEELMFNVKGLEADAAIDFFKKEVQRKNPSSPLQNHGRNMEVEELILKCGGLPKVIAAIAGLLATQTVTLMDSVRSLNLRFIHHLETKAEMYNLRGLFSWMHSYFSTCPDFLKPCIFYLSIFPRGQAIRRRRLVRRWIAEGYSRDSHNESAEENGEKHFSELLELSIVQHVTQLLANQFSDTRQVLCQVNGFMREYIVSQRIGENLVFELGGKCALTSQRTGRHLIILQDWDRDKIVFETTDFSRLRSLTVFGHWKSFFISESMKMLRVLDLENASGVGDEDLVEMVKWLRRLKFLSLRGCHGIFNLPGSLSDLRQLQTLDVRGTSIFTLPESITKLKKLQYIRAGTTNDILVPTSTPPVPSRRFSRRRHRRVGVEVARRIGKLTMLHTLGVVNVVASGGKALLEKLKKLTQLRKLGVSGVNMKNSKDFVSAISGHVHLESLSVHLDKDNEGCLDDISLPCENLQSLKLYGLQNKLPLPRSGLSKLSKLALEMDTLQNDGMEFLAKLPELRIIYLRVKQLGKLHFHAEMYGEEMHTFEKVKILEIACSSDSLHVTFGSKSMKNLELLKIDCSSASYRLTGLNDLYLLKTVFLKGTNDETLRTYFESQLVNHPTTPAVKLEGVRSSS